MKRNDVVWLKKEPDAMWSFYGRIIRIIDDKALWICCGKYIHLTPLDQLEVIDYKGKVEWDAGDEKIIKYFHKDKDGWPIFEKVKFSRLPRFERMPTLRKLKQMASHYHKKNVWKTPLDYEFLVKEE